LCKTAATASSNCFEAEAPAENLDEAIEKHGVSWVKLLEGKLNTREDYPGFERPYKPGDIPARLSALRKFQSYLLGQHLNWLSIRTVVYAALDGHDVLVLRAALDGGFELGPDGLPVSYRSVTLLPLAVESGDVAIVQELLARGADPRKGLLGKVTIYRAAEQDRADIMTLFLQSGIDLKNGQWAEGALHVAARAGAESVITLLLDYGADPEAEMFDNGTLLEVAASSGQVGAICLLLRRGVVARPADKGGRPLILQLFMNAREDHLAKQFEETLEFLLQAGISLHVKNEQGSLIHYVLAKTPQLIDKLWEFKTPQPVDDIHELNVKDDSLNSNRDTPLWLALRLRHLDRILDLLCVEPDLCRRERSRWTLLEQMLRFWGNTSLYDRPFFLRRGPMRRNPPIPHDTSTKALGLDAT
jgi:ankyrin repeat protein